MSRGFIAALIGIVLTIVARVGPWHWPGWPAVTVLDFYLAHAAPSQMSGTAKALGLLVLFAVNVGFWGAIARALMYLWSFITRRAKV